MGKMGLQLYDNAWGMSPAGPVVFCSAGSAGAGWEAVSMDKTSRKLVTAKVWDCSLCLGKYTAPPRLCDVSKCSSRQMLEMQGRSRMESKLDTSVLKFCKQCQRSCSNHCSGFEDIPSQGQTWGCAGRARRQGMCRSRRRNRRQRPRGTRRLSRGLAVGC